MHRREHDETASAVPGAEHFTREEVVFPRVTDPIEPTNRIVARLNYELLSRILSPLGTAYRWAVPLVVRTAVGNFGTNITYPVRAVSNLLQADFAGAWDDAPVSFEHVARQLDAFYNAPMALPQPQREERIEGILAKVVSLNAGKLEPSQELPFTRLEAEFLIGLSFRWDLQSVLLSSQERYDMGVLRTRRSAYQMEPAFVEAGVRRLFERCDLRDIEDALRSNEHVRFFANEHDFLLRPEDSASAKDVFGSRATFFPAGGQLGNLHRKDIQATIRAVMERAEDEAAVEDRTTAPEGAAPDLGGRRP